MRFFCFIFFISVVFNTAAAESPDTDYSEAIRILDVWLEAQLDYDRLPGMAVAVVKDQELIWSKGYGYTELENGSPVTPNTMFSICSISKLFTSIAVMQLRDAGKLDLDTAVADLVPWFNLKYEHPEGGPVTIRSLLSHVSGLPREADHPYWSGPEFPFPSTGELKKSVGGQSTQLPAFSKFQYSNLGLSLLGEVVSRVSGISFEEYVTLNILKPLGMKDTRPDIPKELWGTRLAKGYGSITRKGTRDKVNVFQARGMAAAAGFSSTVQDMARFVSWQFRLLEEKGETILKWTTLREMQRVQWMNPDWTVSWGFGFSVYKTAGRTFVGHGGTCPGYRSILVMDPEKKWAYIVMTNANGPYPTKYTTGIREMLAKVSNGQKDKNRSEPALEDYAGIYNPQPMSSETAVLPWQGKLAVFVLPVDSPARRMFLLERHDGDVFRKSGSNKKTAPLVTFQRDGTGRVIRMISPNGIREKIK